MVAAKHLQPLDIFDTIIDEHSVDSLEIEKSRSKVYQVPSFYQVANYLTDY